MSNWIIRIILLGLTCVPVWAQRSEAGIVMENDLFTSSVNDKYYTNGIELLYRYAPRPDSLKKVRKIHEIRIGQYIWNPQTVKAENVAYHDRPFAGQLSAQYFLGWFHNNGRQWRIGTTLGIIGPESGAEETQKLLHQTLNYHAVSGWQYEIRTTPVIQLEFQYLEPLFSADHVDFSINARAFAGTAYTGIRAGVISRFSIWRLQRRDESMVFGSAVGSGPGRELVFSVNPGVQYQGYDATIQGSPFNEKSPITWPIVPWRFVGEARLHYRSNRWCASYSFVYRGQEAVNRVNTGYFYGSIGLSYLF